MNPENPHWRDIDRPADGKLQRLRDQWHVWRGAAPMPPRQAFRPSDHADLFSWMVLADVEQQPNDYRPYDMQVLFIGSDIAQYFGADGSQRLRLSTVGAAFADRWFTAVDRILATRAPCSFLGTPYLTGFAWANFEMLLLPFADGGADIKSLLAAFSMSLAPIAP